MQKGQNIHFILGGKFQFSDRGEGYVYLKKSHPGVSFTSPTYNMPLKESYNLQHCKKNCSKLAFWVFTEQLNYQIILGAYVAMELLL